MAWIEAHQTLQYHPKTKRAARLLGVTRPQVIGHLFCLWWWCLDYAVDGDLSNYAADDIADAAEWNGDPELFVTALSQCGQPGFLTTSDGRLLVNDWEQYGGKYTAKRDRERNRQREKRAGAKSKSAAPTISNNVQQSGNVAATISNVAATSGNVADCCDIDKSREDKKRERDRPPAVAPVSIFPDTDPEWGVAISKLEQFGMLSGSTLVELGALWPDLANGRRGWIDDACNVARASGASSPAYAVRVLANAVKAGRAPGQSAQRSNSGKAPERNIKKLLGLEDDD